MKNLIKNLVIFSIVLFAANAMADYPRPWQLGFQEPATPLMEQIEGFHDVLLIIIYAISAFVLALLAYTCFRFRAKNNPVPSKNTHNTLIEIIWTAVPVIILVLIAIPSMRLLYYGQRIENTEMTLKVIGNQWYWSYQYPDYENLAFDSNMIKDEDIKPGQFRLLEVDNPVVLPVDTKIRVQITAADVIHDWAVPAFGTKTDAVPGKLNETWIEITKTGTYYGQCSELCGVGHAFMPIRVEVVSKEQFAAWVKDAQKKFAAGGEVNEFAGR